MTDQYHKMLKTILQILLLKQASEKVIEISVVKQSYE